MNTFHWWGGDDNYFEEVQVDSVGEAVIGRYGGVTEMQEVNEDGAVIWTTDEWTLAAVLDGHMSVESTQMVAEEMLGRADQWLEIMNKPMAEAIPEILDAFPQWLASEEMKEKCRAVKGETALLVVAQKEQFLGWISIGDCVLYLLHEDLANMGQYALNQRQFFEWVGQVNSFDRAVSTYTRGVRELRPGTNTVLLTTDGLLEEGDQGFSQGDYLYQHFREGPLSQMLELALVDCHRQKGRDSATLIAWDVDIPDDAPCANPTG